MSKLDDALKRFEQVATLGMRDSDYRQVSDSLAWFREDLAVIKTALSKKDELLGLYKNYRLEVIEYFQTHNTGKMIDYAIAIYNLEKEIEGMK